MLGRTSGSNESLPLGFLVSKSSVLSKEREEKKETKTTIEHSPIFLQPRSECLL